MWVCTNVFKKHLANRKFDSEVSMTVPSVSLHKLFLMFHVVYTSERLDCELELITVKMIIRSGIIMVWQFLFKTTLLTLYASSKINSNNWENKSMWSWDTLSCWFPQPLWWSTVHLCSLKTCFCSQSKKQLCLVGKIKTQKVDKSIVRGTFIIILSSIKITVIC